MLRVVALLSVFFLAACTTTSDGPVGDPPSVPPGITLSFVDIQDAPNQVQDYFYSAFGQSAFRADVPWDPGLDGTVLVRAFLSLVPGNSGTLLIYVFDFDDVNGRRLFRVSDRISSPRTYDDPWDMVTRDLASEITLDAIGEFVDWVNDNDVGV